MIKANWIGEAYSYGVMRPFISFTAHDVELLFTIQKETELTDEEEFQDRYFTVERIDKKLAKTAAIVEEIYEEVQEIWLIKTDEEFRKRFQHNYYLLKFYTENTTLTLGAYSDTKNTPTAKNSYILCTTDFVNLLAKGEKVERAEQLSNTNFKKIGCLLNKKELAKELLR